MVIVSRTNISPVPDKAGEVRSVLEDYVRSNPNNIRWGLFQDIIGEVPAFQVVSIFDTLEEYEKNRDANYASEEYVHALANLNSRVRQPNISRLGISIVDPIGQIGPEQRYTQQVIIQPNTGEQDNVRGIVENFAKGQQANGRPLFRVTQALLGHTGQAISALDSYETLAELENVMRQRAAAAAEFWSALAGKLRAASMSRLREVIVPIGN